jgi:hypothetical protein
LRTRFVRSGNYLFDLLPDIFGGDDLTPIELGEDVVRSDTWLTRA